MSHCRRTRCEPSRTRCRPKRESTPCRRTRSSNWQAGGFQAAAVEAAEPEIREELEYWTGRARPAGTGLPADVLPEREQQTTVPGRDFGRAGTLPIGPGHDRVAVYAVLYGDEDDPCDWLRAGEALSAGWLRATELGVSVVPLSGVIEVASTRQTLRALLAGLGHPYLVLRLGSPTRNTPARHTPHGCRSHRSLTRPARESRPG